MSIVPDTRRVRQELERAFQQAGGAAGQRGGQSAGGGIADALSGLGGKTGAIGMALGSAFALAGVSVGGLFVKALQQGMEREKALDMTQARLGVDDATMRKIGHAAGAAYTDAFGESVEENVDTARRAIQAGLLDPAATAQQTQAVISQLSGISDIMGEEIPAVARAAGQAVKTGIAQDAAGAFDLLAAAERNGLNVSEDMLDTITEYGTQFRKLGLTGPEAFGLINQAVQAGARDADTAADAIKEFSIRAVDGSESSSAAYEALGMDAEEMSRRFAQGGESAWNATQEILLGLRGIEDPLERGQVAVGLFGTKWEDLGGAFDAFDLETAASSLGQVAGSAQRALDTMGGNAATSIESAQRSIKVSTDEISSALAQAFGPSLAKLADWVTQHQPEILGFLGKMVDGAFAVADATLQMSVLGLRHFANFTEGVGPMITKLLEPIGVVAQGFGKLTGNKDLENFGESVRNLNTTFDGVADRARELADGIDSTARPALDRMRNSIGESIDAAVNAETVMRALGDTVTTLPDGHTITLEDNTPETTARLEQLGLKVTTLPDGKVTVTADTATGQQMLDDFVARNHGKTIPVSILASLSAESQRLADAAANSGSQTYSQGYVHYAQGGIAKAGPAAISDRVVNQWAEDGLEAYVPLDPDKRARSIPIWLEAGRHLGMIQAWANGGLAGERATMWASSLDGAPYIYGSQDCSWYMSGIYNKLTGNAVRFTTADDLSQYGFLPGNDPSGFTIGNDGGSGTGGHMAGRLLGTNVESDGLNGVQFGGSADGPEGFPQQWYLPRDLWDPPATDDPSLGTGGAALGGPGGGAGAGASGGASVPGGGGGAGSPGGAGVSVMGQDIPAGVTPVWVVNGLSNSQTVQAAPAESVAPAATQAQPAEMPDVGARLGEMGGDFVNANVDQFLGDLGFRRTGGAIQALTQAIFDAMAQAAAAEVKKQQNQQGSAIAQFIGGR